MTFSQALLLMIGEEIKLTELEKTQGAEVENRLVNLYKCYKQTQQIIWLLRSELLNYRN